jgi:hypothetical protein
MTIFGELFGGDQVDAALISVLETWMPTYLKEVVRQRGLEIELDRPRSIVAVSEFETWPEEQTPSVVIVNPETAGTPKKQGDGSFGALWSIEVCISVSAATQSEARRNSQLYIAAARGCIMQRRSLGVGMEGTDWGGESYELIGAEQRRTKAGAKASFVVGRDPVLTVGAGPTDPEADPQPEDWPEVKSTNVTVEKEKV